MNITEVVKDAIRGRPPSRRGVYGPADPSPPAEFLRLVVWPLLAEARDALEARSYRAIATRPPRDDPSHGYALLILDSSCQNPGEACFLRFLILDGRVCVSVKNPRRSDKDPWPLDPSGNVLLVQELLADFIFQCLTGQQGSAAEGTTGIHKTASPPPAADFLPLAGRDTAPSLT